MKRTIILLVLSTLALAQGQYQVNAALSAQDSGACSTAGACLVLALPSNQAGSASIQLQGTFTATVQFEATADPAAQNAASTAWQAISGTPTNSTTTATSSTGTGLWRFSVGGLTAIRVRVSSYGSGTVNATVNTANVAAGLGGGGGNGTVTSVTFTGDGTVLSSTPSAAVTTSGTLTAALANAAATSVLGNTTGAPAAPSFTASPVVTSITAGGHITSTATPATTGIFRCASADSCLTFRNNANAADIALAKTGAASGAIPADALDVSGFAAVSWGNHTLIRNNTTQVIQFGGIATNAPVAQSVIIGEFGTGSNIAGGSGTLIQGGRGTGTGALGLGCIAGYIKVASGSGTQTQVNRSCQNAQVTYTSGSPVTVVSAAVAASSEAGGVIKYCAQAENATDFQARCGFVSYAVENKGGVFVAATMTPTDTVAVSTGTLTVSWAATGANPSLVQATVTSSLTTPTKLVLNYSVENLSSENDITPQNN